MSRSLCLDLGKYGVTEHSCGCLIDCPLEDVADALGLRAFAYQRGSKGVRGLASYTAGGKKYVVRAVAHARKKQPRKSCFHIGYKPARDDVDSPANYDVNMTRLESGLSALFGPCEANERNAVSYVDLEGSVPVLSSLAIPPNWPDSIVVSGANLTGADGSASAIVQAYDKGVLVSVSVEGGSALSPKQIRSGFLITVRLAEAFRGADWDAVEREAKAYERL